MFGSYLLWIISKWIVTYNDFLESKRNLLLRKTLLKPNEFVENLSLQDLQEAKEQLILEMADTLSVSRAFAESLLRHNDWSREAVMENMRLDPIETCIRAGLQAPLEPPTFTG